MKCPVCGEEIEKRMGPAGSVILICRKCDITEKIWALESGVGKIR